MKSGFIAILGKPNVGKSSLMNALIGEKISIVSPKPQTTRDKILGIVTTENAQMIFVDTPGVHTPKNELGEYMLKAVSAAASDVDAIVIVLDATKPLSDAEIEFTEKYLRRNVPVYLVINKTDLCGYEKIYPMLSKLAPLTIENDKRPPLKEIIPCSAKTGENIELLKGMLEGAMVEGNCYFAPDEITDKSERYLICEIIREKALLYLQDEIPHGIGIHILSFKADEKLVSIEVDIICEKQSHKQIIIGKDGDCLKNIGEKSRLDIEHLLRSKVFLKLFVKVRPDWRKKKSMVSDLGYDKKNL